MEDKKLKRLYPKTYSHFYTSDGNWREQRRPTLTWDLGSVYASYELCFRGEVIGGYKQDDIREHIFPKIEKILKRRN